MKKITDVLMCTILTIVFLIILREGAVMVWFASIIVLILILGEIRYRTQKKKEDETIVGYQNPEFLREPNDKYWKDEELREWHNSSQYYVKYVIKQELKIPEKDFWSAYWLGKNLWYYGASEEKIKEELERYAEFLKE